MIDWHQIRSEFPILERYTYLNTARFCALPKRVAERQEQYTQHLLSQGSWNFDALTEEYEATRDLAAKLLGTSSEHTFFLSNVSTGINLSVNYLKPKEVILVKDDFPSVTIPWERHQIPATVLDRKHPGFYEQLEQALSKGNMILCVSWIQSEDGFEIDLERVMEWVKRYEATLVLDGTQGFTAIPFEVDPAVSMVFLSSGFKWMMAGYGVAIGYLSEDLIPKFKAFTGWNSMDFAKGGLRVGAASLEVGNAMYRNVLGLGAALSLIEEIGIRNIRDRNLTLKKVLTEGLNEQEISYASVPTSSSIVQIKTRRFSQLKAANIQVTDQGDQLRTSHHFYNNEQDINTFLSVLSEKGT